jgi:peptidoglycan/LPS O-acetylase OafA/YrhL
MAQHNSNELVFRGHIAALDGVRGIAILTVLLSHFLMKEYFANERAFYIAQNGWMGVDLFFVLSGFLITGILLDSRDRPNYWSGFYRRRALRILPLYYFVVIVTWITIVFIEKAPERLQGYDSFVWYFTFTPNIAMGLKNEWLWHSQVFNLNHLWSLAVEEQFYLFWPLVVRYSSKRGIAVLALVLLAMGVGLRNMTDHIAGNEFSVAAYTLTFCRMDGLAAGAFVAAALRLGWIQSLPYKFWVARILFCWTGWEILQIFLHGTEHRLYTLSPILFACLLLLALNPHPRAATRRVCEHPFLQHLGKYSYGLYVFHHMFEYAWKKGFGDWLLHSNWPPLLAQSTYILLAFAGTWLLARLSWRWIEQPFLRLK